MTLFQNLLADAFFSAIAATGFAVISNPPKKAVAIAAMLSAIGHSFRYYLLHAQGLDLATSTFFAAFLIGLLSFAFGKLIRCPSEVFTFPSLLPMIPGMYAYNMFLSLTKFIRSDSDFHPQLIEDIFKNGLTAVFVMLALVVGVSIPMLFFHEQSYQLSRPKRH
ncbi:MAG: threonine/serine exporter family protein [Rikenellaceae bacterium]